MARKTNYVNNRDFLEALIRHQAAIRAKEGSLGCDYTPDIEYIATCIQQIATKLSNKSNFYNYTFKDDMISDGIVDALEAIMKFNPTRSVKPNPFAYFTQIIHNAFIRRILQERKQTIIRLKLINDHQCSEDADGSNKIYDDSTGQRREFLEVIAEKEQVFKRRTERRREASAKAATNSLEGCLE